MQYMDVVWRSFRISWRHKYLWLIALFSGEGAGAGGFNFNFPTGNAPTGTTGTPGSPQAPDFTAIQDQVTKFLTDYAGLIAILVVAWIALVVVFFILAAVCEGATVRASAEHDADRPWGLRMAWRAGRHTMWPMIRFRLLIFLLGLPIAVLAIGIVAASVIAFARDNNGLGFGLVVLGVLLLLPVIVYAIYLYFLDRLGARALVLEQVGARDSIVRAHRLLFKRLGRTLLVWLLAIAVGFVVGILTACALAIVFVPLAIIGGLLVANNSSAILPLAVLAAVVVLPISLVIGGFLSAQGSTYWTLAYRRLDLDPLPLTPPPPPPAPLAPQPS
jgi:hypothetical protein